MSHFLDGTAYGGHINLVRLLNSNYWWISEIIGAAYGWVRCGEAFGLTSPLTDTWWSFFNIVSAFEQSTLIIRNLIAFILVFYLPLTSPPPKTMVSRSSTPPTCRTSPPYSPPLQTPIFGWLLCGNSSCGGCLSPQCIPCSFIFGCSIQCPKWWCITVPPHLLPVAPPLHTPHCCGHLFLVGCCVEIVWSVAV